MKSGSQCLSALAARNAGSDHPLARRRPRAPGSPWPSALDSKRREAQQQCSSSAAVLCSPRACWEPAKLRLGLGFLGSWCEASDRRMAPRSPPPSGPPALRVPGGVGCSMNSAELSSWACDCTSPHTSALAENPTRSTPQPGRSPRLPSSSIFLFSGTAQARGAGLRLRGDSALRKSRQATGLGL